MPASRSAASSSIAALISGALAGLAGAGEVGGVRYQVTADLTSGYGYAGIVIATLAELNPLGAIPAALFFAIVFNGAGTMSRTTRRADLPRRRHPGRRPDDHGRRAAVHGLSAPRGAPCLRPHRPVFEVGFFAAIIRIATPLLLATLGELISERSGVLNLGIEGIMLLGAMVGFTAAYFTGSLWLGVARGDR